MAVMATKFDVLPPLEEWDINLEVGSQVYQLLKGFKQLRDKLSSERSIGKPPCGGTLSGRGGITRREQALRV